MNKVATINVRIEPALKHQAEAILNQLQLSSADAIRLLYSQICLHQGLPFEVKLPNEKTIKAIKELEAGRGKRVQSMKEIWDALT